MKLADFKCTKCNIFKYDIELDEHLGKMIMQDGKWIDKNTGEEVKQKDIICDCGSIMVKLINKVPIVWGDNLIPGQGFTAVDKRHNDGPFWDSAKSKKRADDANAEARYSNEIIAKKTMEADKRSYDDNLTITPVDGNKLKLGSI